LRAESQLTRRVSLVVDVAESAATSLIAAGRFRHACELAAVGLGVEPTNESLFRLVRQP